MFKKRILTILFVFISVFTIFPIIGRAGERTAKPIIDRYESDENSSHEISNTTSVSSFSHGRLSAGNAFIKGKIETETMYGTTKAYGVNDVVTIGYTYDGALQSGDSETWKLTDEKEKVVNNTTYSEKINKGILIVEKSVDGNSWSPAIEPIYDFFDKNKSGKSDVYITPEEEIKYGIYYRMIVAYEITKKDVKSKWYSIPKTLYRKCTEVYTFFIASENNYVVIKDMETRDSLTGNAKSSKGFYFDINNANENISVKKSGTETKGISDGAYYTTPGDYDVTISTRLGKDYKYSIKVTDGAELTTITPSIYESTNNTGYKEDKKVEGIADSKMSYTSVHIGTAVGHPVTKDTYDNRDAYGITGSAVSLFLRLNYRQNALPNGWVINSDEWGKNKDEKVYNLVTGQVGKGALILQTSSDGKNWTDVDKGRYAKGLYTTDFATHFDSLDSVLLYTPDGKDVSNGLFIRIVYAFEVKKNDSETYKNYIEKYEFYMCKSDIEAVTIKNLSMGDKIEKIYGDEKENVVDVYKKAETMLSGAATVSGFEIDNSLNPTVSYEIYRNDELITNKDTNKYTEPGKYDITLKNRFGKTTKKTIYVYGCSEAQALDLYFRSEENDDSIFLYGKRIYSPGKYPIYEAGSVYYHIEPVDNYHLPIKGSIKNKTTGKEIKISNTRVTKNGKLDEAGEYEAIFTTNSEEGNNLSGDYYTFTFRFTLIPEGTAPGPTVNQGILEKYGKTSMMDAYPIYYGLTYQSRRGGRITQAFVSANAAWEFAYERERSMVEIQEDGTYQYCGSNFIAQKDDYDSDEVMELTEAMNTSSESAVQKLYFDMSNPTKYATLQEEVIESTDDLRDLALYRSVIVFDKESKDKMMRNTLPIVNDKVHRYVLPDVEDKDKNLDVGEDELKFTKDKYGIDSYQITITDCNGKEYPIEYEKSVGKQLEEAECPTGVISINEVTKYGDSNNYKAIFVRNGDNTGELEVEYNVAGEVKSKKVNKANANTTYIYADFFTLGSFSDEIDPYSLITIDQPNGYKDFCAGDNLTDGIWMDSGEYTISVINRLGYKFSFKINLTNDYSMIVFSGEGMEEKEDIITQQGEKDVSLGDVPVRKGYILKGYKDEDGKEYNYETIDEIDFLGTKTLMPIWVSATCELIMLDQNDAEIEREEVEYGSSYTLHDPELDDDYDFVRWTRDGEEVSGEIQVDADRIVLIAETVKKDISMDKTSEKEREETKEESNVDIKENITEEKTVVDNVEVKQEAKPTFQQYISENAMIIGVSIGVIGTIVLLIIISGLRKRASKKRNTQVEKKDDNTKG